MLIIISVLKRVVIKLYNLERFIIMEFFFLQKKEYLLNDMIIIMCKTSLRLKVNFRTENSIIFELILTSTKCTKSLINFKKHS